MIKITSDEPSHGWLPVTIKYRDIEEVFYASNIPVDPIIQLSDVLDSAITGVGGEVWWHLEPGGYYLSITSDRKTFHVSFDYSEDSKAATRERIFEFDGGFDQVVVPIWRFLRRIQSKDYDNFMPIEKGMESISREVKLRKGNARGGNGKKVQA